MLDFRIFGVAADGATRAGVAAAGMSATARRGKVENCNTRRECTSRTPFPLARDVIVLAI